MCCRIDDRLSNGKLLGNNRLERIHYYTYYNLIYMPIMLGKATVTKYLPDLTYIHIAPSAILRSGDGGQAPLSSHILFNDHIAPSAILPSGDGGQAPLLWPFVFFHACEMAQALAHKDATARRPRYHRPRYR